MSAETVCEREIMVLNGQWTICEATGKDLPDRAAFTRKVPVPGLVDLAGPEFVAVGTNHSGICAKRIPGHPQFTLRDV